MSIRVSVGFASNWQECTEAGILKHLQANSIAKPGSTLKDMSTLGGHSEYPRFQSKTVTISRSSQVCSVVISWSPVSAVPALVFTLFEMWSGGYFPHLLHELLDEFQLSLNQYSIKTVAMQCCDFVVVTVGFTYLGVMITSLGVVVLHTLLSRCLLGSHLWLLCKENGVLRLCHENH